MTIRTSIFASAVLLASAALAPSVSAQTTPAAAEASFAAGAKVSDTAGGEVGTVTAVEGDFVILKTDKHEVRLPKSSFTAVQDGFLIAMTRDQLNAAVEQTLAKTDDLVTVGATVRDTKAGVVGSIEKVEGEFATVKLASGTLVQLPVSAFGAGAQGPVISLTAAELEAQVGAAASAAADAATADAAASGFTEDAAE